MAYQHFREARRLKQIREAKQQAAELNAVPLANFLKALEGISTEDTVIVLYTGNTQAHLEPCGCFIGQSGGVPRRATAISRIRAKGFAPLLVDLGGLLPPQITKKKPDSTQTLALSGETGDSESSNETYLLDRLRAETTLAGMGLIGYEALVPSQADANFGEAFIEEVLANQPFKLLAANLQTASSDFQPILIKTVGRQKIALIGLSALKHSLSPSWKVESPVDVLEHLLPQVEEQADFIVLLSNFSPETNREIAGRYGSISAILSPDAGNVERVGEVLLAYSSFKGKTVGALMLNDEGGSQFASAQQIALTEAVADEPNVRALLTDFYNQVKNDSRLQRYSQPLFFNQPLEQDTNNTYIGSAACQECHQKEANQWSHTSHAVAFNTLRYVGREFYPECVSCHVTGFGYETGYQIDNPKRAHLAEVGCETCHGPGKGHVYNPTKENIRGKVEVKLCADCHTPSHSPGFERIAQQLMPEVDHSRPQPSLKAIIDQRLRGPMKPKIELFVMSYCPFTVQAERELLPFLAKYGQTIDFKLRFIASETTDADKTLLFTSLRGEVEVIEDIRQMVIAELYPEALFDYLLCRGDHLQKSWTECAKEVGLDVDRIAKTVDTEQTKQRFSQEIRRAEELGIRGSPILVIDGRQISGHLWRGKVSETCR